jgi:uncharacterized membrane protein
MRAEHSHEIGRLLRRRKAGPRHSSITTLPLDLFALFGLVLVLPVMLLLPSSLVSVIRIPLGLIMALFAPGYAITAALIPRRVDLDRVARGALSIGLSVALIPALAVVLDTLPWGIRLWPIFITLSLWITTFSAVALVRRRNIESSGAVSVATRLEWPRLITVLLVVGVVIAGLVVLTSARSTWHATEFYVLGTEGRAENYPRQVTTTDEVTVTIGIVNGEPASAQYRIEVWVVDTLPRRDRMLVTLVDPIRVSPGERHEQSLSWTMPWPGSDQRVELLLFANEGQQPLRQLELWMNVIQ